MGEQVAKRGGSAVVTRHVAVSRDHPGRGDRLHARDSPQSAPPVSCARCEGGLSGSTGGVLRAMRTRYHGPRAEATLKALGTAGEWGAIWVGLVGLGAAAVDGPRRAALAARRGRRRRRRSASTISSSWRSAGARPRLRRLPPLAGAPSELSFPSAHATSSFAAATAMGRVAPGARLPLYALAGAICVTRPYLGMHYPSDVLGGAAFGLLIGALWPGVRPKDVEDRLIDLVADAARPRPTARRMTRPRATGRPGGEPPPREDRHRRPAERRQDDAVQRAHSSGRRHRAYPFTTVDPNVAMVEVPDDRLAQVAAAAGASPALPETIEFHDIAGLVRGAAGGEGLGNRFLAAIRETDAICHVVRAHPDERRSPSRGRGDPVADAQAVEAELPARRPRAGRGPARAGSKAGRLWRQGSGGGARVAGAVVDALRAGGRVREVPAPTRRPMPPLDFRP